MTMEIDLIIEKKLQEAFDISDLKKRLPKEDFERIIKAEQKIIFKKGDVLFGNEERSKGVYVVEKGMIKLSKLGVFGKEQILRFIKEGDLIGYRSLLCSENLKAKAEAMTDVETTFIPADIFLYLVERDSKLSYALLQKFAYELGESSNRITLLAQKTVRERLAEIFLILERRLGKDAEGYINITLTREEIANLIGTATESAIRLISEFKNDNLISVDGRNIKIINHDKLMKLGNCC